MNRKLKKAIQTADFWADLEIEGTFSDQKDESLVAFRDTDDYKVFTNDPAKGAEIPHLVIIPNDGPSSRFSEADRQAIIHNEILMFKVSMIFRELEEKGLSLDKKNRQKFMAYLGDL